jgi:hypothetical protein
MADRALRPLRPLISEWKLSIIAAGMSSSLVILPIVCTVPAVFCRFNLRRRDSERRALTRSAMRATSSAAS